MTQATPTLRTPPGQLPDLAVISVTGSERVAFLNALITADIRHLPTGSVRRVAWCDAKGRVERLLRLLIGDREIAILCGHDEVEALTGRLKLFSLRRDVNIAPATGWHVITDTGPESGETPFADVVAGRFIGLTERPEAWRDVQAAWNAAEIANMVPLLPDTLRGEFLPQMLNLEALDGLGYKKGCYPGQEIIARLHFRGELKRELAWLAFAGSEPPAPGDLLTAPSDDGAETAENPSRAGVVTAVALVDADQVRAVQVRPDHDQFDGTQSNQRESNPDRAALEQANQAHASQERAAHDRVNPEQAAHEQVNQDRAEKPAWVQAVIPVGPAERLQDAKGQSLRILCRQSTGASVASSD